MKLNEQKMQEHLDTLRYKEKAAETERDNTLANLVGVMGYTNKGECPDKILQDAEHVGYLLSMLNEAGESAKKYRTQIKEFEYFLEDN